eukprot:1252410-Pyramimonas_sp.AAC.1
MTITCARMLYANKIIRRVGSLGYRAVAALEVLGVEVASGRAIRHCRLRARLGKISTRKSRFRKVRRAGEIVS